MKINYVKKDVGNFTLKTHALPSLLSLRRALHNEFLRVLDEHAKLISDPYQYAINEGYIEEGETDYKDFTNDQKEQLLHNAEVLDEWIMSIDRHFKENEVEADLPPRPEIPE